MNFWGNCFWNLEEPVFIFYVFTTEIYLTNIWRDNWRFSIWSCKRTLLNCFFVEIVLVLIYSFSNQSRNLWEFFFHKFPKKNPEQKGTNTVTEKLWYCSKIIQIWTHSWCFNWGCWGCPLEPSRWNLVWFWLWIWKT